VISRAGVGGTEFIIIIIIIIIIMGDKNVYCSEGSHVVSAPPPAKGGAETW
jgi:hypothetical protein